MNATVSHTHTFGSTAVNQLTASYGRSVPTSPPLYDLGGPTILFADNSASAFGWARNLVSMRLQNTYQYADTLTFGKGRHQWKLGADFNRIQSNTYNDQNERGVFQFTSISDFLAGRPLTYTQRFGNSYRGLRVSNSSFFLQDDWRPARRLTVNLGIRLEMAGAPGEVNGLLSNLNLRKSESVGGAGTGPLGVFDVGGPAYRSNWSWAPRLGFAWNPNGGALVVRGGYGSPTTFRSYPSSRQPSRYTPADVNTFHYRISPVATASRISCRDIGVPAQWRRCRWRLPRECEEFWRAHRCGSGASKTSGSSVEKP